MTETRSRPFAGRVTAYPADAVREYRAAGLWGTSTIVQEFQRVAAAHPHRDALVTDDGTLSYAELDARTDLIARGLGELGLRPGDPVVFQVTNRPESVLAWYAMLKAGLVPVCALAFHRAHEISQISRLVGAVGHLVEAGTRGFDLVAFGREQAYGHPTLRHLVAIGAPDDADVPRLEDLGRGGDAAAARAWVDEIQAGIDPDDVAVFQLSGGTTGVPKVIPRLHAEYWYNATAYARAWNWDETSRVAHLIPIIHNAGIICALHAAHSVGGCLVLATPDLDQALPLMAKAGTTDVLVGHGHYGVIDHPAFRDVVPTLRTVVLSGAKVSPELFGRFEDLGLWTGQLFGMGEGLCCVTFPGAPRRARNETVGTPLSPLDEIRILEPGSETAGSGRRRGRALRPGPVHPPRVLRRPRAQRPGIHQRRLLPHGRPRAPGGDRRESATSASRAASRTSSTAAARRSTPRRWSCSCCATRRSPPPRWWRCPILDWGSARVPTWWRGPRRSPCRRCGRTSRRSASPSSSGRSAWSGSTSCRRRRSGSWTRSGCARTSPAG